MAYPSNEPDENPAGSELRQFIERIEQFESEAKEIAELKKEVYAEAKGRGFDTKVIRFIVSQRKKNKDDVAEFEAIKEMYIAALGDFRCSGTWQSG